MPSAIAAFGLLAQAFGLQPPDADARDARTPTPEQAEFAKTLGNYKANSSLISLNKIRDFQNRLIRFGWLENELAVIAPFPDFSAIPGGDKTLVLMLGFADHPIPPGGGVRELVLPAGSRQEMNTLPSPREAYQPKANDFAPWAAAIRQIIQTAAKNAPDNLFAGSPENIVIVYTGAEGEPGTFWSRYRWRFDPEKSEDGMHLQNVFMHPLDSGGRQAPSPENP